MHSQLLLEPGDRKEGNSDDTSAGMIKSWAPGAKTYLNVIRRKQDSGYEYLLEDAQTLQIP